MGIWACFSLGNLVFFELLMMPNLSGWVLVAIQKVIAPGPK